MAAKLRYGVIGTGMMGVEHLKNLALLPGAEVVAFADPHEESRRFARLVTGPQPAAYEDPRALLDDARVDAVVIATPNHTHRALLEAAFAAKKHLLVEKPLCTTVADARWAAERAARHPAVVWTAMEYRYMAPVARLVDEVRRGTIGRLRMLAIREHRFPFLPKVGNWNRFARNTGGTLVEKCCHFFDLMRFVVGGEAVRVYASAGQDVNHLGER
jgi:myo-inositol 2-dehydrogenase/D-chiro-inositol 1-dehydrogenase